MQLDRSVFCPEQMPKVSERSAVASQIPSMLRYPKIRVSASHGLAGLGYRAVS